MYTHIHTYTYTHIHVYTYTHIHIYNTLWFTSILICTIRIPYLCDKLHHLGGDARWQAADLGVSWHLSTWGISSPLWSMDEWIVSWEICGKYMEILCLFPSNMVVSFHILSHFLFHWNQPISRVPLDEHRALVLWGREDLEIPWPRNHGTVPWGHGVPSL